MKRCEMINTFNSYDTLDTFNNILRDNRKEYGYTYSHTYIQYINIIYNIFESVVSVINDNTMAINYSHTKKRYLL